MNIPREKVEVIHLAGRDMPQQVGDGAAGSAIAAGIGRPYALAFSSLSAHKNIPLLVSAFARISSSIPHALVLVGHMPEKSAAREAIQSADAGRVIFTGYIPDSEVDSLMRGASLFAFPSLYEGFGLPILDAQLAGVPVACSSAGALPEVAGEGAVVFDPHSVDDISESLLRCLTDTTLRESLIASGLRNARRFSWERTARRTLDVYRAAAG
jgi:glycosyltransferase involved in cell wall biosynthesis